MKPEDYMDEEDMAEYGIAPRKVVTKDEYTTKGNGLFNQSSVSYHNVDSIRTLLNGNDEEDVLYNKKISLNESIGIKLLKNIGWKEGRGIGEMKAITNNSKKIYGCALPPGIGVVNKVMILPEDTHIKKPEIRTNDHGLGYVPICKLNEITTINSDFKPTGREKSGIRGEAFGTGVLEDDDEFLPDNYDVYAQDTMDNYDYTLESKREKFSGIVVDEENNFILSNKKLVLPHYNYNLPKIPNDYKPKPKLGVEIKKNKEMANVQERIDPLTKSMILGDVSAKEYIERNKKKQLKIVEKNNINLRENLKESCSEYLSENLIEKLGLNVKMKKFVKSEQGNDIKYDSKDILNSMEVKNNVNSIISKRSIHVWIPEKMLCKRFNVPYLEVKMDFNNQMNEKVSIFKLKSNKNFDLDDNFINNDKKINKPNIINLSDKIINNVQEMIPTKTINV